MATKNSNSPVMLQGESVRILPQNGSGPTIAELCAQMTGDSGPTQTALKDSAKPPSIKAPNSEAGGVSLVIGSIVVLIILTLIAYGACRWLELL